MWCIIGVVTSPTSTASAAAPPTAATPRHTHATSCAQLARVSCPTSTRAAAAAARSMPSAAATSATAAATSAALTTSSQCASHRSASISPSGSIIFTPLSPAGLCDAVTMHPTAAPPCDSDRIAAHTPTRSNAAGRSAADARNPAVPYLSGVSWPLRKEA